MVQNRRERIGQRGAKGGFAHEGRVAREFNDWQRSAIAQGWLQKMGIDLLAIDHIFAERLRAHCKTDITVSVSMKTGENRTFNLSCKRGEGNQIDKRPVDHYVQKFEFSPTTAIALKKFTGELGYTPWELVDKHELSKEKYEILPDKRRFTFDQLESNEREAVLKDFQLRFDSIVHFILSGDGDETANWMIRGFELLSIEEAIKIAGGDRLVAPTRSGFRMGNITVQRKGGTPDPTKLQFKWT